MSWRIVVDGYISPESGTNYDFADAVVSASDTDEQIAAVAHEWGWQRPLKLLTPSLDDPTFRRLVEALWLIDVDPDDSYRVFLSGFVEVDVDRKTLRLEA